MGGFFSVAINYKSTKRLETNHGTDKLGSGWGEERNYSREEKAINKKG